MTEKGQSAEQEPGRRYHGDQDKGIRAPIFVVLLDEITDKESDSRRCNDRKNQPGPESNGNEDQMIHSTSSHSSTGNKYKKSPRIQNHLLPPGDLVQPA